MEFDMDKGLARGYARTYLRNIQAWRPITEAFRKELRRDRLFEALDDVTFKSKPVRAMKRIRALLPKGCEAPILIGKRRGFAVVCSTAIGRVGRNAIYTPGAEECAFHEASVEMGRIIMTGKTDERDITVTGTTAISGHAIQRMLQRGATTPETLEADVRKVLYLADHVNWRLFCTKESEEFRDHSLLIPFRGGALAVAYVAHNPMGGAELPDGPIWFMSIRTFLAPEMLGCEEWQRMGPMERELEDIGISEMTGLYYVEPGRSLEELEQAWIEVIRANARPREFFDSTLSEIEPEKELELA